MPPLAKAMGEGAEASGSCARKHHWGLDDNGVVSGPSHGRLSHRHAWLRLVSSTALRISRVTTSGCDTMDACEAAASSIRAFPRLAMNRCPAGGMARSSVPSRYHDGIERHVIERDNLNRAVAARHRVGLAQGILMTRRQLTSDQAFALLKHHSQNTHVKLRTISQTVIETGDLPVAAETE